MPAELSALARYRAELNERLVVHWTGGAWRVPLGTRHLAVAAADGSALGRIVCAEAADAARALSVLAPAPAAPDPGRLADRLAPVAALLDQLRRLEGAAGADLPGPPPGRGPVLLATPAGADTGAILAALAVLAPRGAVWLPAPQAAASAHLIARALAPVLGRAVAMLQGDRASAAALVDLGLSPAGAGPGRP